MDKTRRLLPDTDDVVQVYVNSINEGTVRDFHEKITMARDRGQDVVPVYIDSYGGHVHSVLAIADIIDSCAGDMVIATIAMGKAMSAGSFLLSCGTKGYRYASASSVVMVHDVTDALCGKETDIASDARETKRIQRQFFQRLSANCDQEKNFFLSELRKRGNVDWYLTPKMAKRHGLIDEVRLPMLRTAMIVVAELV
jgi:ATP-dependent Clp protease protease subunit